MLAPRKKLWSTPSEILHVVSDWITLKTGDKVCDIGCGDGRVLIHLAAHWTSTALNSSSNNSNNKKENSGDDNTLVVSELLSVSFVGLDINPDRVREAALALEAAKQEGRVHPDLSVNFHCANAMEDKHLYQDATVFFLYLIPRGLKIFKPLLLEVLKDRCETQTAAAAATPTTTTTSSSGDASGSNNTDRMTQTADATTMRVFTYMSPLPGERYTKRQVCEVEHQPGSAWPVYLYHLTQSTLNKENTER